MELHLSGGPHIHGKVTTQSIMRDVIIAMLPTTIAGIYLFGIHAAIVVLISIIAAVAAEYLWMLLAKKPMQISDLSAVVTGMIIGLNMPPNIVWWIPVIGSAIAIIIVKQLFGGIGDNFINPAMGARAVLLASWPVRMTAYTLPINGIGAVGAADAVSSATPLVGLEASTFDLFMGNIPGSIGEVCKIAILIGFVYLLVRHVISWRIPVIFLGVTALLTWILGVNGGVTFDGDPLRAILMGGVMFGAVFMATDYTTSPMSAKGQIIYAIGCGLIVVIIRTYGGYPEGVTYAILLMNVVTPLIDKYVKSKVYGEVKADA